MQHLLILHGKHRIPERRAWQKDSPQISESVQQLSAQDQAKAQNLIRVVLLGKLQHMEGCFEHEERVSQVTLWATPSPSLRLDLGCFNHHQTCKAEGESGVTDISSVESFTWQLLDFAVGLSSTDSRPVDDYTTLQVPLFRNTCAIQHRQTVLPEFGPGHSCTASRKKRL